MVVGVGVGDGGVGWGPVGAEENGKVGAVALPKCVMAKSTNRHRQRQRPPPHRRRRRRRRRQSQPAFRGGRQPGTRAAERPSQGESAI